MKIKPKFEYECYHYTGIDAMVNLINWMKKNGCEVLNYKVDKDSDEIYIYYLDKWIEPQSFVIKNDWYAWFDEIGVLNSGEPSYVEENYEFVKENELNDTFKDILKAFGLENMRHATKEEMDSTYNYMMKNSVPTGKNIFEDQV